MRRGASGDDGNAAPSRLCGTNHPRLPLIPAVMAPGDLFLLVPVAADAQQGVVCTPQPPPPIRRPPTRRQLQFGSRGGKSEGGAETCGGNLRPRPRAGTSVRQQNDLLREPLFICDKMASGYFVINGVSHGKALIDVDSPASCAAC